MDKQIYKPRIIDQQVEEYLAEVIQPVLDANPEDVGLTAELSV